MYRRPESSDSVVRYYQSLESRLGYRLFLNGEKHLGWHPHGLPLNDAAARRLMTYRALDGLTLPDPSSARILDAGCGLGAPSRVVAGLVGQIDGISIVPFEVDTCTRRRPYNAHYHLMSYQDMGFESESFDGVYTIETLSHATDIRQALHEMFRVLRPKSRISFCEYTMAPDAEFGPATKEWSDLAIAVGSLSAMPSLRHGTFPRHLTDAGFADIVVETHTAEVLPSLRRLHKWAHGPSQVFKKLGVKEKFGNTQVADSWGRLFEADLWRFVTVTATKS